MPDDARAVPFLLYGFQDTIFDALKAEGFRPRLWVRLGGGRYDGNLHDTLLIEQARLNRFELAENAWQPIPVEVLEKVKREAFHLFLRNTYRRNRCIFQRRNIKYYEDVFDRYINYYHKFLSNHKIEFVLFGDVPHKGADMALYFLARELGVRTYITFSGPTFLPLDTFTIVERIDDIGLYETAVTRGDLKPDLKPVRVRPVYMNRLRRQTHDAAKNLLKATGSLLVSLVKDVRKRRKTSKRFSEVCRWLSRLAFIHHAPNIGEKARVDDLVKKKYVYVPLHMEPEMVIDVLGGKYCPQMRFVERLREIFPEDVALIVKENPAQSFFGREKPFYERLRALRNVHYIKDDVDTFLLMENALAVAAVLGTAGWEALKLGKPVICGGYAWYRGVTGVFSADDVTYEDIENYTFSREAFERDARRIAGFYTRGLPVDTEAYTLYLDEFDPRANARQVAAVIKNSLSQRR